MALKATGSPVTVSVLRTIYAEDVVHQALPGTEVDQFDNVDVTYQAPDSGRADTATTDASSLCWFIRQNADPYSDADHGWDPQNCS